MPSFDINIIARDPLKAVSRLIDKIRVMGLSMSNLYVAPAGKDLTSILVRVEVSAADRAERLVDVLGNALEVIQVEISEVLPVPRRRSETSPRQDEPCRLLPNGR